MFVVPNDFGDHEGQEFAREFRVEIGLAREAFQACLLYTS